MRLRRGWIVDRAGRRLGWWLADSTGCPLDGRAVLRSPTLPHQGEPIRFEGVLVRRSPERFSASLDHTLTAKPPAGQGS
jgi:hypothetical protein